jgi:uncharacterized surface anchored protein
MPITDSPTSTITDAQRFERVMRQKATNQYKSAKESYETSVRLFWTNGNLTPQEASDALGTDAGSFFTFYSSLRTFILDINPSADIVSISDFGTFTINGDGTVTIDSVV